MAQWSSSYLEKALSIPKIYGDVFGVALFALTLGIGRSLYGKFGKNIEKILVLGSFGPQLVGIIIDLITISPNSLEIANSLNISIEQFGMKVSMLIGSLFPLIGTFVFLKLFKTKEK